VTQGITDNERWAVRAILSVVVVGAAVVVFPSLILYKALEGFHAAARIVTDCLRQVWWGWPTKR
jgi:hypothetical protein